MTVTNSALEAYAKSIINHNEEYEAVKDRVFKRLMIRFVKENFAGRESISDIINSTEIFMAELRIIIAENANND